MESHLQSLTGYFASHPGLALAAIVLASLLESLALIGTVVPGSSIVFVGGMLIGLDALPAGSAFAAAIVGAVAGDGASYWLGHHYRDDILSRWPVRRYPWIIERGQAYFERHGGKSVFFARFVPPVRAVVPVVAGMSGMPAWRFAVVNVASALAWAAAHLVPGWLFGASLALAGAISSRLAVLLVLVTLAGWAAIRLVHLVFRSGWPVVRSLRDRAVRRAHAGSGTIARLTLSLLDPSHPESQALLVDAAMLAGGAWVFLAVLEDVVTTDTVVQFDQTVYTLLQGVRTEWADRLMVLVTEVGGAAGTVPLIAAIGAWLAAKRYWRTLAYWLAAPAFAQVLVRVLKATLGRARPNDVYTGVEQFSFPSGHAVLGIVVYGFLAFLVARGKTARTQMLATLVAMLAIVMIAFSRLYLGVHWFSDVLAGLGLGLAWVALLGIAYVHHRPDAPLRAYPVALIAAATLTLVALAYAATGLSGDLRRYAYRPSEPVAMTFDRWRNDGWRSLPTAREDARGEHEEPITLQWVGTGERLATALDAAGWHAPPAWFSEAALLWLLPSTPVGELPVLPKLDQGEAPHLTLVKVLDARRRVVLRLWPWLQIGDASATAAPAVLWLGSVTLERARSAGGLLALVRTERDFATPLRMLGDDLACANIGMVHVPRCGAALLLAWPVD
jgi:undecaprenyl-diphosphatase